MNGTDSNIGKWGCALIILEQSAIGDVAAVLISQSVRRQLVSLMLFWQHQGSGPVTPNIYHYIRARVKCGSLDDVCGSVYQAGRRVRDCELFTHPSC